MAKLDQQHISKPHKTKKPKAKKREHAHTECEDGEVANKSVVVELDSSSFTESKQVPENKTLKRKHKNQTTGKEKHLRSSTAAAEVNSKDSAEADGSDDNELCDPTQEELRESQKPENTKAIVTVRQKKKQKHKERLETQKGHSVNKEMQKNIEYLQKWKNARTEWKFEKLRQISLQLMVFDDQKLEDNIWPVALEYLSSSKGAAKERIGKLAEAVINELDAKSEKLENEVDRQAILDSPRYQRARQLLQSFD